MKVRREQRLGCPKLSTQFTLNAHPMVFNVLGVDGVIIRIHEMLMMDDDIMSVNSMVDVFDLSVLKLKVLKFKAFLTLNILRRLTEAKYFLKILRRLTEALPTIKLKYLVVFAFCLGEVSSCRKNLRMNRRIVSVMRIHNPCQGSSSS